MPTPAQITANQQNSQHSTGPKSEGGKGTVALNAVRHGLTGAFMFLPGETPGDFDKLQDSLRTEHEPETGTEIMLVETMARHYWLMQRAIRLQTACFNDAGACDAEKELGLYLRYQSTHERAFYKALNTVLRLRAEKRKARLDEAALCQRAEDSNKIGFVSQAKENRERERAEKARQQAELNEARVRLANAKAQHLETDSDIRQTVEAPLPGHMRIPFDELSAMFRMAVDHVNRQIKEQETKQAA